MIVFWRGTQQDQTFAEMEFVQKRSHHGVPYFMIKEPINSALWTGVNNFLCTQEAQFHHLMHLLTGTAGQITVHMNIK